MKKIEITGDVPLDLNIENGDTIMILSKSQSSFTHGLHRFPAKFFPELPRYLIQKYSSKGQTVFDPMCGSGTVLLEANLLGRNAIGMDIDPVAKIISKAKTKPINPKTLEKCRKIIFREILKKVSGTYNPEVPSFHYREKWFESFVLRELGIIREAVNSIRENGYTVKEAEILHRFFSVVFSSIIRDVSNADSHCTRTVIRKNFKKKIREWDTVLSFLGKAEQQIDHMKSFFEFSKPFISKSKVKILTGDARKIPLPAESVDLAVTSPPYCNAVDYPRTHQLEMYWLGLTNGDTLAEMKRKYIGTETVYKAEYAQKKFSRYPVLDEFVSVLFEKDKRLSFIVHQFFMDIELNLLETFKVLKRGGRFCIVIGNNSLRGLALPSHAILAEIATIGVGFELEKTFFSGLIRHYIKIPRKERMAGEWVLILRKPIPFQQKKETHRSN